MARNNGRTVSITAGARSCALAYQRRRYAPPHASISTASMTPLSASSRLVALSRQQRLYARRVRSPGRSGTGTMPSMPAACLLDVVIIIHNVFGVEHALVLGAVVEAALQLAQGHNVAAGRAGRGQAGQRRNVSAANWGVHQVSTSSFWGALSVCQGLIVCQKLWHA